MRPLKAAIVGQEPEKEAPKSLADLAKASGRDKKDVTKVTIVGGGGGAGDSTKKTGLPKHGSLHPRHKEDGANTLVYDQYKKTWVRRADLSEGPTRVVIERK